MVDFQAKVTVNDELITDEAQLLGALQSIWPGMIYNLDVHEMWADGTWIVSLPMPLRDETTIEKLDIVTRDGVQLHAVRD
jgi:hypothetical protein